MFDVCLDLFVCLLARLCERERESSHLNSIYKFLNGFMFMSPGLLEMLE